MGKQTSGMHQYFGNWDWDRILATWFMSFPVTPNEFANNFTNWPAEGSNMRQWFHDRPHFEDIDSTATRSWLGDFPLGFGRKAKDCSDWRVIGQKQREWLERRPNVYNTTVNGHALEEAQRTPTKQQTEAAEPAAPRKPRGQKKEDSTAATDGATAKKRGRRAISKTLDRNDGDKDESSEDAE